MAKTRLKPLKVICEKAKQCNYKDGNGNTICPHYKKHKPFFVAGGHLCCQQKMPCADGSKKATKCIEAKNGKDK